MLPWDKLHGAMTHFPIALLAVFNGLRFRIRHVEEAAVC